MSKIQIGGKTSRTKQQDSNVMGNRKLKLTSKNSQDDNVEQEMRYQRQLEQEMRHEVSRDLDKVNIDFNEIEEKNYQKRLRQLAIRKWLVLITICVSFVGITFSALYKVFHDKQTTPQEMAYYANLYNGQTNFPSYGVQNFLSSNMNKLTSETLSGNSDNTSYEFRDVSVDNIYKKTDTLADVYFYATLYEKDKPGTRLYFMIPLQYNVQKGTYKADSAPLMTSLNSSSNNSDIGKSSRLEFNNKYSMDSSKSRVQQTFVDNFFKMFYDGQDVSPFYKGVSLKRDHNQKYGGMNDFHMYSRKNKAGYNAVATINIGLPNGYSYTTQKYLLVVPNGKTYTINAMN